MTRSQMVRGPVMRKMTRGKVPMSQRRRNWSQRRKKMTRSQMVRSLVVRKMPMTRRMRRSLMMRKMMRS